MEGGSVAEVVHAVLGDVWRTVVATWPFLLVAIVAAAALDVYVGADRLGGWLRRRTPVAVLGAVALASATPFCSCGTTAVTLGMVASHAPWAPIVAFMVASPLTSPSELVLSAGLLGWPFAWTFFLGTIVLGLLVGAVTGAIERTGWLVGQARLSATSGCASTSAWPDTACGTPGSTRATVSLGPGAAAAVELASWWRRARLPELVGRIGVVGPRLLVLFLGFTALGYLLIEAIPTAWVSTLLGGDGLGSIVAAALLGIPAYVNTEGSLPLVAGLVEGGMGPGPAMAFLVTGAGTSLGAVGGMLVIARRRIVALVVASLVAGAVGLGTVTQLLLG
jgi:uncharacterized membrane protein YraQ (UPF0718 family)